MVETRNTVNSEAKGPARAEDHSEGKNTVKYTRMLTALPQRSGSMCAVKAQSLPGSFHTGLIVSLDHRVLTKS